MYKLIDVYVNLSYSQQFQWHSVLNIVKLGKGFIWNMIRKCTFVTLVILVKIPELQHL